MTDIRITEITLQDPDSLEPNELYELGEDYFYGQDVKVDKAKAIELWLSAAEKNHRRAIDSLGNAYYHGDGVEKDLSQAIFYWTWCDKLAAPDDADPPAYLLPPRPGFPQVIAKARKFWKGLAPRTKGKRAGDV